MNCLKSKKSLTIFKVSDFLNNNIYQIKYKLRG